LRTYKYIPSRFKIFWPKYRPLNRKLDKNQRPKRSLQKIYETKYCEKFVDYGVKLYQIKADESRYSWYYVKHDKKDFIREVLDFGKMFLDRNLPWGVIACKRRDA